MKATKCYLRFSSDYLEDAKRFLSITAACEEFHTVATDLARFGQSIEATIHVANNRGELAEYPEYALSLGVRGGLKKERC